MICREMPRTLRVASEKMDAKKSKPCHFPEQQASHHQNLSENLIIVTIKQKAKKCCQTLINEWASCNLAQCIIFPGILMTFDVE